MSELWWLLAGGIIALLLDVAATYVARAEAREEGHPDG